jgi:hypothetical protein
VWSGGFAVPEFIYVVYGTTEVVPFQAVDFASKRRDRAGKG